jgi:hypothetical protein
MAEVTKEERERRQKEDKRVTTQNKQSYSKNNIKSKEQTSIKDGDKVKIVERCVYKNGVVKQRMVGILKRGKVISNYGIDKKFLKGGA